MQELSGGGGGAPVGNGEAPQRIEAGPGGYDNGGANGYGEGDRDLKPWQRGPTGQAAPWQRDDRGRRDDYGQGGGAAPPWAAGRGGGDNYGGYEQRSGGYGGAPGSGAAPWQRQQDAPPPPPSGGQGYGYGAYPGGAYGDSNGGYGQSGMGAPPGLGAGSGGLGAPPGLSALFQQYSGSPVNGSGAPPPPPPGDAPPPPVSSRTLFLAEQ